MNSIHCYSEVPSLHFKHSLSCKLLTQGYPNVELQGWGPPLGPHAGATWSRT